MKNSKLSNVNMNKNLPLSDSEIYKNINKFQNFFLEDISILIACKKNSKNIDDVRDLIETLDEEKSYNKLLKIIEKLSVDTKDTFDKILDCFLPSNDLEEYTKIISQLDDIVTIQLKNLLIEEFNIYQDTQHNLFSSNFYSDSISESEYEMKFKLYRILLTDLFICSMIDNSLNYGYESLINLSEDSYNNKFEILDLDKINKEDIDNKLLFILSLNEKELNEYYAIYSELIDEKNKIRKKLQKLIYKNKGEK